MTIATHVQQLLCVGVCAFDEGYISYGIHSLSFLFFWNIICLPLHFSCLLHSAVHVASFRINLQASLSLAIFCPGSNTYVLQNNFKIVLPSLS